LLQFWQVLLLLVAPYISKPASTFTLASYGSNRVVVGDGEIEREEMLGSLVDGGHVQRWRFHPGAND
jgi:hypothetical protein